MAYLGLIWTVGISPPKYALYHVPFLSTRITYHGACIDAGNGCCKINYAKLKKVFLPCKNYMNWPRTRCLSFVPNQVIVLSDFLYALHPRQYVTVQSSCDIYRCILLSWNLLWFYNLRGGESNKAIRGESFNGWSWTCSNSSSKSWEGEGVSTFLSSCKE